MVPGVGVGLAPATGVGVGDPPVRPTPPHPVRRERATRAKKHTSETFFKVIKSCPRAWLWKLLPVGQNGKAAALLHISDVICGPNVGCNWIYLGLTS